MAKLIAMRESNYTMYVFQNEEDSTYIMCTRMPHWQTPVVVPGEAGFLEYEEVKAGDIYYEATTETNKTYKYSNIYFINFVTKNTNINNSIIRF